MDDTTPQAIDGIAIVGMAGRFPGAATVQALWRNLVAGRESITFFNDEELLAEGIDAELLKQPNYVPARGSLDAADHFDAAFFGHSPKVAELMDPQHRLFLECAWHALEDAGYDSEQYRGRIGVFAGSSLNTYVLNNLYAHLRMVASVESLQASIGNDKDSLTTEVSYKLNLTGPSVTVQTSSSTSLAAVHIACQSLLAYECDMALSGGVSLHFPERAGYLYQEGGATSRDGHCRAFDAEASGFVNGHGAGIVVLKRLEDALSDGDTIYAVIRGSATNNDGAVKVSYMAPSIDGQAQVIAMAQAIAGTHPETISYIEAHGTGTNLGDPIEIAALTKAFRAHTDKTQFCAIGSLKPNIGHLDTAAGVVGLIKAALALYHEQIPPSINFRTPNPQLELESSPFFVNTTLRPWPRGPQPRRAGVSSFGMGGANVHAILEEAPLPEERLSEPESLQLLTLSAKTASALDAQSARLAAHLREQPALNLADAAYTLQRGRRPFAFRRAIVSRGAAEAIEQLEGRQPQGVFANAGSADARAVAFLFPGQGAQYVGMARDLYDHEPVFRAAVDQCCALLEPHLGLDLRAALYPPPGQEQAATDQLTQTAITQPALFVVAYALAQLWQAWGVQPAALLGHSIGEYIAATLAGVFTLEDALALVAERGRLMQTMPAGSMLAVPLSEAELRPLLPPAVDLAAVNAPDHCVASGPAAAIDALEQTLAARAIESRRLHTSHAFHSAMLDPILPLFEARVRRCRLNAPQRPVVSNVTGAWLTAAQAVDPAYWAQQLRQPVRFAAGLQTLLENPDLLMLEVGPGQTLSTFVRQHPARRPQQIGLPSLRHPREQHDDRAFLLGALGRLWLSGITPDWDALHQGQRRRIALPTYPFERQRYLIEPLPLAALGVSAPPAGKLAAGQWCALPFWKPSPPPGAAASSARWLLLNAADEPARSMAALLQSRSESVTEARPSELATLLVAEPPIDQIVYFATPADANAADAARRGFEQLAELARTLSGQSAPVRLTVIGGDPDEDPASAALLGACTVLRQELASVACRYIGVAHAARTSSQQRVLSERLIAECAADAPDLAVLYRDRQRLVRAFEPAPLELDAPGSSGALRQHGVYLITGGLGALGLALAEHLASTLQARLALIGRSGLPARERWAEWLDTHPADDPTSRRIMRVQAIEARGGEVLTLSADVADRASLARAIEQTRARFDTLHGVFHAAGVVGRQFFQLIQESEPSISDQHFRAKLDGVTALADTLADSELDFVALMGSLSVHLGGIGYGAYAAANQAMNAAARRIGRDSATPWLTIDWDAWQITVDQELPGGEPVAIEIDEGMAVLERLLAVPPGPEVVVSAQALAPRLERWASADRSAQGSAEQERADEQWYPRPDIQSPYVAPRNETERRIAAIWQDVLRIERVGVNDNFFDLGGNSLSGLQVISQLKKAFDVHIAAVSLYEGPTVAALAQLIAPEDDGPQYEAGRSRGERRRERRRERRG